MLPFFRCCVEANASFLHLHNDTKQMEILNISWNNNNKTHTLYKMWSTLVIKYAYQAILQLYRVGFLNMQWNCSARKSAWDIYELATNYCRSCRSKYTQMRPEVAFTVGATWNWPGEHSNRTEIRRCHCTNGWKAPSALVPLHFDKIWRGNQSTSNEAYILT